MIGGLLVLAGAVLSALAFPRIGPGWLILPGIALFLAGLRMARSRAQGLLYGALYGLTFFGGLIWWIGELGLVAVVPLVVAFAGFHAALRVVACPDTTTGLRGSGWRWQSVGGPSWS